jgi:hypothetical protein
VEREGCGEAVVVRFGMGVNFNQALEVGDCALSGWTLHCVFSSFFFVTCSHVSLLVIGTPFVARLPWY